MNIIIFEIPVTAFRHKYGEYRIYVVINSSMSYRVSMHKLVGIVL